MASRFARAAKSRATKRGYSKRMMPVDSKARRAAPKPKGPAAQAMTRAKSYANARSRLRR